MDILEQIFPKVVCLETFLSGFHDCPALLPVTQGALAIPTSSLETEFDAFLHMTLVGIPPCHAHYPGPRDYRQYSGQEEVVERVMFRLKRQGKEGRNVLLNGCHHWGSGRGCSSLLMPADDSSSQLYAGHWCKLLSRIGDELMMHILENLSVFIAAPPSCYIQVTGPPVSLCTGRCTMPSVNSKTEELAEIKSKKDGQTSKAERHLKGQHGSRGRKRKMSDTNDNEDTKKGKGERYAPMKRRGCQIVGDKEGKKVPSRGTVKVVQDSRGAKEELLVSKKNEEGRDGGMEQCVTQKWQAEKVTSDTGRAVNGLGMKAEQLQGRGQAGGTSGCHGDVAKKSLTHPEGTENVGTGKGVEGNEQKIWRMRRRKKNRKGDAANSHCQRGEEIMEDRSRVMAHIQGLDRKYCILDACYSRGSGEAWPKHNILSDLSASTRGAQKLTRHIFQEKRLGLKRPPSPSASSVHGTTKPQNGPIDSEKEITNPPIKGTRNPRRTGTAKFMTCEIVSHNETTKSIKRRKKPIQEAITRPGPAKFVEVMSVDQIQMEQGENTVELKPGCKPKRKKPPSRTDHCLIKVQKELKSLLSRHKKVNFTALLNHHCPVVVPQKEPDHTSVTNQQRAKDQRKKQSKSRLKVTKLQDDSSKQIMNGTKNLDEMTKESFSSDFAPYVFCRRRPLQEVQTMKSDGTSSKTAESVGIDCKKGGENKTQISPKEVHGMTETITPKQVWKVDSEGGRKVGQKIQSSLSEIQEMSDDSEINQAKVVHIRNKKVGELQIQMVRSQSQGFDGYGHQNPKRRISSVKDHQEDSHNLLRKKVKEDQDYGAKEASGTGNENVEGKIPEQQSNIVEHPSFPEPMALTPKSDPNHKSSDDEAKRKEKERQWLPVVKIATRTVSLSSDCLRVSSDTSLCCNESLSEAKQRHRLTSTLEDISASGQASSMIRSTRQSASGSKKLSQLSLSQKRENAMLSSLLKSANIGFSHPLSSRNKGDRMKQTLGPRSLETSFQKNSRSTVTVTNKGRTAKFLNDGRTISTSSASGTATCTLKGVTNVMTTAFSDSERNEVGTLSRKAVTQAKSAYGVGSHCDKGLSSECVKLRESGSLSVNASTSLNPRVQEQQLRNNDKERSDKEIRESTSLPESSRTTVNLKVSEQLCKNDGKERSYKERELLSDDTLDSKVNNNLGNINIRFLVENKESQILQIAHPFTQPAKQTDPVSLSISSRMSDADDGRWQAQSKKRKVEEVGLQDTSSLVIIGKQTDRARTSTVSRTLHSPSTDGKRSPERKKFRRDKVLPDEDISVIKPVKQTNLANPTMASKILPSKESQRQIRKRKTRKSKGGGLPDDAALLIKLTTSQWQVYLFVRHVLLTVVPDKLWGSVHNRNVFMKSVKQFVSLGRFEQLSLRQLMANIKVDACLWSQMDKFNGTTKPPFTAVVKQRQLVTDLFHWLMSGYVVPLITMSFYVTETATSRNQLVFYRKPVWSRLERIGIKDYVSSGTFSPMKQTEAERFLTTSLSLGYSQLRFVPKTSSLRPITKMGKSMLPEKRGFSIRLLLQDLFDVLTFYKTSQPSLLGSSILGMDSIYDKMVAFIRHRKASNDSRPLYFVKLDIEKCFDSIKHNKLYQIISLLLQGQDKPRQYLAYRYLTVGNTVTGKLHKTTRRHITISLEGRDGFHSQLLRLAQCGRIKNAIIINQVSAVELTPKNLLQRLKQHVQGNILKIGGRYYHRQEGISQGSILSSLLCSFFYAHLERCYLSDVDREGLLMRMIDDFLLITPHRDQAERFLHVLHAGVKQYGCSANPSKTLTNFDVELDGQPIPRIPAFGLFPWCGLVFNTQTLSVSNDYAKYNGVSIRYTLTMQTNGETPLHTMRTKLVQSLRAKSVCIFLEPQINSFRAIVVNVHHLLLLLAFRFHSYYHCLPGELREATAPKQLLGVVTTCLSSFHALAVAKLPRSEQDNETTFPLTRNTVRWIGLRVFDAKLSCHRATYKPLISLIRQESRKAAFKMGKAMHGVLLEMTTPAIPEDFLKMKR